MPLYARKAYVSSGRAEISASTWANHFPYRRLFMATRVLLSIIPLPIWSGLSPPSKVLLQKPGAPKKVPASAWNRISPQSLKFSRSIDNSPSLTITRASPLTPDSSLSLRTAGEAEVAEISGEAFFSKPEFSPEGVLPTPYTSPATGDSSLSLRMTGDAGRSKLARTTKERKFMAYCRVMFAPIALRRASMSSYPRSICSIFPITLVPFALIAAISKAIPALMSGESIFPARSVNLWS